MKKMLALLMALVLVIGITACGKKGTIISDEQNQEITENVAPDVSEETEENEKEHSEVKEEKPAEQKPVQDEKPEEKPVETAQTVGTKLLSVFKSNANGSTDAIANAIIEKGELPFAGMAMGVEPGLLNGFDNAEISGFKTGTVFAPMIGSIPFIGYIFELDDGVSAQEFISNLKKNANLRWNICVEADEMVTGNVGNKVFFVMCPKEFDEAE